MHIVVCLESFQRRFSLLYTLQLDLHALWAKGVGCYAAIYGYFGGASISVKLKEKGVFVLFHSFP
jgi:hypothetical protein